jgi:hypothetical protein
MIRIRNHTMRLIRWVNPSRPTKLRPALSTTVRALHNSYFLKEDGLFFSSKALGLVFSATYLRGSFALFEA